jgi:hypothetical protein
MDANLDSNIEICKQIYYLVQNLRPNLLNYPISTRIKT